MTPRVDLNRIVCKRGPNKRKFKAAKKAKWEIMI